jgi:hypothetical protein
LKLLCGAQLPVININGNGGHLHQLQELVRNERLKLISSSKFLALESREEMPDFLSDNVLKIVDDKVDYINTALLLDEMVLVTVFDGTSLLMKYQYTLEGHWYDYLPLVQAMEVQFDKLTYQMVLEEEDMKRRLRQEQLTETMLNSIR